MGRRVAVRGRRRRGRALPLAITAQRLADVPAPLADLVQVVVPAPALRERPEDVEPLARHLADRARGRPVGFTPAALLALRDHTWPGNAAELAQVVRSAAGRTDEVDVRHLPAEVLSGTRRRLTRRGPPDQEGGGGRVGPASPAGRVRRAGHRGRDRRVRRARRAR